MSLLGGFALAVAQNGSQPVPPAAPERAIATFAGACFWCVEADFDKVKGVRQTISGHTGGHVANPTYEQVSSGTTGHAQSVEMVYHPCQVSYQQLLSYYWHHIDPIVKDRQFCDCANQYRTAIMVHNAEQKKLAEAPNKQVETELKVPIYTQIVNAGPLYKAVHQGFYKKNLLQYELYRWNGGCNRRVKQGWGGQEGDS